MQQETIAFYIFISPEALARQRATNNWSTAWQRINTKVIGKEEHEKKEWLSTIV